MKKPRRRKISKKRSGKKRRERAKPKRRRTKDERDPNRKLHGKPGTKGSSWKNSSLGPLGNANNIRVAQYYYFKYHLALLGAILITHQKTKRIVREYNRTHPNKEPFIVPSFEELVRMATLERPSKKR